MQDKIFIPKTIKVGFQERDDTYTKKLAYVIYYDAKGVLRKETSWKGWIDTGVKSGLTDVYNRETRKYDKVHIEGRDPLPTPDFDNVPTEGFVLNKGVGGTRESYGWNARNEYIRVYDPRNFEFEISVANLLFILSETNSIKGKGLDGEFVYGWSGKELILIPTCSYEYKNSLKFTENQSKKVSAKSLKEGFLYETKQQTNLIYLGKLLWNYKNYELAIKPITSFVKSYIFIDPKTKTLIPLTSLTSLAECKSDEEVENFAELMDILMNSPNISPVQDIVLKPAEIIIPESRYTNNEAYCIEKDGKYIVYQIMPEYYDANKLSLTCINIIGKDPNGKIWENTGWEAKEKYAIPYIVETRFLNFKPQPPTYPTKEDILNLNLQDIFFKLENGKEIKYSNYKKV